VAVKFSDNDHVGIFERYGVPSISRSVTLPPSAPWAVALNALPLSVLSRHHGSADRLFRDCLPNPWNLPVHAINLGYGK